MDLSRDRMAKAIKKELMAIMRRPSPPAPSENGRCNRQGFVEELGFAVAANGEARRGKMMRRHGNGACSWPSRSSRSSRSVRSSRESSGSGSGCGYVYGYGYGDGDGGGVVEEISQSLWQQQKQPVSVFCSACSFIPAAAAAARLLPANSKRNHQRNHGKEIKEICLHNAMAKKAAMVRGSSEEPEAEDIAGPPLPFHHKSYHISNPIQRHRIPVYCRSYNCKRNCNNSSDGEFLCRQRRSINGGYSSSDRNHMTVTEILPPQSTSSSSSSSSSLASLHRLSLSMEKAETYIRWIRNNPSFQDGLQMLDIIKKTDSENGAIRHIQVHQEDCRHYGSKKSATINPVINKDVAKILLKERGISDGDHQRRSNRMTIKESKHRVGVKNPDKISRPNHNHSTRHVGGDHGSDKENNYVDQKKLCNSQSEQTLEITEVLQNRTQIRPLSERTAPDHDSKSAGNMKYEVIVEDADDGCRGDPDYSKRRLACRSVINMEDERIKKQNQNQNQKKQIQQTRKDSESFLKLVEEACRIRMECASDLQPPLAESHHRFDLT